jgi:hypothetical protein
MVMAIGIFLDRFVALFLGKKQQCAWYDTPALEAKKDYANSD